MVIEVIQFRCYATQNYTEVPHAHRITRAFTALQHSKSIHKTHFLRFRKVKKKNNKKHVFIITATAHGHHHFMNFHHRQTVRQTDRHTPNLCSHHTIHSHNIESQEFRFTMKYHLLNNIKHVQISENAPQILMFVSVLIFWSKIKYISFFFFYFQTPDTEQRDRRSVLKSARTVPYQTFHSTGPSFSAKELCSLNRRARVLWNLWLKARLDRIRLS